MRLGYIKREHDHVINKQSKFIVQALRFRARECVGLDGIYDRIVIRFSIASKLKFRPDYSHLRFAGG